MDVPGLSFQSFRSHPRKSSKTTWKEGGPKRMRAAAHWIRIENKTTSQKVTGAIRYPRSTQRIVEATQEVRQRQRKIVGKNVNNS